MESGKHTHNRRFACFFSSATKFMKTEKVLVQHEHNIDIVCIALPLFYVASHLSLARPASSFYLFFFIYCCLISVVCANLWNSNNLQCYNFYLCVYGRDALNLLLVYFAKEAEDEKNRVEVETQNLIVFMIWMGFFVARVYVCISFTSPFVVIKKV